MKAEELLASEPQEFPFCEPSQNLGLFHFVICAVVEEEQL